MRHINRSHPRVRADFIEPSHRAQPRFWVRTKQFLNEILQIFRQIGKSRVRFFKEKSLFLRENRDCPGRKLICECSNVIVIDLAIISGVALDFRRQNLECPADRKVRVLEVSNFLRKAKICNSDVTVQIQEQILWFEVSVDIRLAVDRVQPKNSFSYVEASLVFCQLLFVGDPFEISTWDKVENKITMIVLIKKNYVQEIF